MSDFGKLEAKFWQRGTGKRLRGDKAAQVLAMYIMSCESARTIGLFYLPWALVTSETGLTDAEAIAAMRRLEAEGFAFYDQVDELAWVPGMAVRRVGESVKDNDKKRAGLIRDFLSIPAHPFRDLLVSEHGTRYRLPSVRVFASGPKQEAPSKGLLVLVEAPSKGHATLARVEVEVERDLEVEREGEVEVDGGLAPTAATDPGCALATHTAPPVSESSNPDAVTILARMRSHPELAPVATVRHAERMASLLLGGGKRIDWLLTAVDELADKVAAAIEAGTPWNDEHMGGKVMAFGRNAEAPRKSPAPKPGQDLTPGQVKAEQARRGAQQGTAGPPKRVVREEAPDGSP